MQQPEVRVARERAAGAGAGASDGACRDSEWRTCSSWRTSSPDDGVSSVSDSDSDSDSEESSPSLISSSSDGSDPKRVFWERGPYAKFVYK